MSSCKTESFSLTHCTYSSLNSTQASSTLWSAFFRLFLNKLTMSTMSINQLCGNYKLIRISLPKTTAALSSEWNILKCTHRFVLMSVHGVKKMLGYWNCSQASQVLTVIGYLLQLKIGAGWKGRKVRDGITFEINTTPASCLHIGSHDWRFPIHWLLSETLIRNSYL